jgi:hypothetical protein
LAEAKTRYGAETGEVEGGDGRYTGMYTVDFLGVGRVIVEEIWWGG